MKFQFEKFGYVDKGTVELGDLTIICGPNDVGKTYVSYSIFNLIKDFKEIVNLPVTSDQIESLRNEGFLTIDLTFYEQRISEYTKNVSNEFSNKLSDYFSTSSDFFGNSKIEFLFNNFSLLVDHEFKGTARFGEREVFIFDKPSGSKDLSVAVQIIVEKNLVGEKKLGGKSNLPNRILERVISDAMAECIFANLPIPFIVTSERTGIALFYKGLDSSKDAILEHLASNKKLDPIKLLSSMRSRYARPIQDNIDIVRDADNFSKQKSFIKKEKNTYKPVLGILQNLLGGSFKIVNDQVFYLPKKERNRSQVLVPFYLASSAVKSLFLIDLYINCLAEKDGLLIIDEPELNLHPDNQRKMASLLARLVNAGVKVLITTHSDYIIRELNNRIMLSNDIENKEEIMNKNSILTEDILLPEQVKAFVVKNNHSIQEIDVDKYGINLQIFDELIAESNTLSSDIYYSIKE
jgi:predicted ATPase